MNTEKIAVRAIGFSLLWVAVTALMDLLDLSKSVIDWSAIGRLLIAILFLAVACVGFYLLFVRD